MSSILIDSHSLPPSLDLLASRALETNYGSVTEYLFRFQERDVVTMVFGTDLTEVPVRIHSTCFSAHYMGSRECDCREQLQMALSTMSKTGAGIVVFLDQDGRGNGHAALMRSAVLAGETKLTVGEAYEQLGYPSDARDFRPAGLVLKYLGVQRANLMTNNPAKIEAVTRVGILVHDVETTVDSSDGPWLADYYERKAAEGHRITRIEVQEP